VDRQIRRLGLGLVLLFVLLLGQISYVQFIAAEEIADNPANAYRQLVAEYEVDRGDILANDGTTVLATSKRSTGAFVFERRYPNGPQYAGITGYYSLYYGRTELEQTFDDYLSGDASELLPTTFADLVLGRPKQGASIATTIDPEVQQVAAEQIADLPEGGAVAAIDPETGDVLALASNPTFDPNSLAATDPKAVRKAWDELNADPEKPLLSRANDELYPPGSTFKIVTASAALANGFGPQSLWPNPHELDLPLTTHGLSNFGGSTCPGGSRISLAYALQISCNVVFGGIGLELGAEKMAEQARAYGFAPDVASGDVEADIPFQEGVFPDPEAFAQREPALAFSAIGQQDVATNPLHMALVAGAIGNDGVMMRPRLVTEVRDPQGRVVRAVAPEELGRPIDERSASQLTDMMAAVVQDGTGGLAAIPGTPVAGKTGTAQHGKEAKPHAWFVAFAPADSPEVAVAVLVLDGGSLGAEATGGQVAAPIAKAVMEAALET
jgi:peptidoglycan glycosyltransferase